MRLTPSDLAGSTVDDMWWCSECGAWTGSRLAACPAGHDRPAGATLYGDVADPETYHRRADRLQERATRLLRSRYRTWLQQPLRSAFGRLVRWSP